MENALPEGTQVFEFGGLILHDALTSWQDSRLRRVAVHEYDRRDGAQTEDMGRAPHLMRCTLVFAGADGLDKAQRFVRLVDENPTRLLVHPIYGRMNATCKGVDGAQFNIAQAVDQYTIPCEFIESNLDGKLVAAASQGVAAKTQAVTSQIDEVTDLAADFAAAVATVALATGAASDFASAVYAAATGDPDPGLPSMQAAATRQIADAIAAIRDDADDAADAAPAVTALLVLSANCADLGSAYLALRPPLVDYVTQEAVHVLVIAGQWYGADAPRRVNEIIANNNLQGAIVPAGTRLKLATATV